MTNDPFERKLRVLLLTLNTVCVAAALALMLSVLFGTLPDKEVTPCQATQ